MWSRSDRRWTSIATPAICFVAQFIGSPSMNILHAKIVKAGASTTVSHPGGRDVAVPVATPADATGLEISLGVRPEDLMIAEGEDYLFEGLVDYVEQLGEVQLAYVDTGRKDEPLVRQDTRQHDDRTWQARCDCRPTRANLHIFAPDGRAYSREQPAMAAE